MKKLISVVFVFSFVISSLFSQDTLKIHFKSGLISAFPLSEIDSLSFVEKSVQGFSENAAFDKLYSSLALTGDQMPAGKPDFNGIDEVLTGLLRGLIYMNDLCSDEIICAWGDEGVPNLNTGVFNPTNQFIEGFYRRIYFNINLCNEYLYKTLPNSTAEIKQKRAEARFLRAFYYAYLVDMFGSVPFSEDTQISRTELYAYIQNELADCENDMFNPKDPNKPYYRLDKAANWLLRARLYLNAQVYTGLADWNKAAEYAKKVIDSGYSLSGNYAYLFMADNAGSVDNSTINDAPNEIIFPVSCDGLNDYSWSNSIFHIAATSKTDMPNSGLIQNWSGVRARSSLIKKFYPTNFYLTDMSDLRTGITSPLSRYSKDDRAMFFGTNRTLEITNIAAFLQGYSIFKYSNVRADNQMASSTSFPDTDIPLMRKAEAYLIYSESVLRGASILDGLTALSSISQLRTRAKAKTITETDLNLDFICDEWSREFFMEGRRRSDLIRFGKFAGTENAALWPWKNGEAQGGILPAYLNLFPIPNSIILANPNISQNPGY